jgi:putative membrane protein
VVISFGEEALPMKLITTFAVLIVAGLHVAFLVLEMFFWTTPIGLSTFDQTLEQAQASAVLAANQGLYNGFLAAGLVWSLFTRRYRVTAFFLLFVVVAGVFGGISAKPTIIIVQALPATLALLLLWATGLRGTGT